MHGTARRSGTSAGRPGLGAVALFATAILVAACSGAGPTTAPATVAAPTTAPTTAALPTTPSATAAAAATVVVRTDATYGDVVTGANGMSLYVFLADKGDGKSACYGDCAGSWPALTVASASALTAGTGVTGTLGTITRDDGTLQVTLGGAPLYYFSGDTAAGDTKGQGLFEKWYVASPAGTKVVGPSAGATPCSGPACY